MVKKRGKRRVESSVKSRKVRHVRHVKHSKIFHEGIQFDSVRSTSKKIRLALKSLFAFLFLSIISLIVYGLVETEILSDFFFLVSVFSIFIALAFLVVLLILLILRGMKK